MKTLNLPLNTNFRMRCFAFTVALALSILSVLRRFFAESRHDHVAFRHFGI